MHVIALFGIILLISLRVVGLMISIEFLVEIKGFKFKILIIGWLTWILAGLCALLINNSSNSFLSNTFRLINGISTSVALLLIMMGLYSYFQKISRKLLLFLSVIFVVVPLIAFLLGFLSQAIEIANLSLFLIVLVYTSLPLRKMNIFKDKLSFKSLYWYLMLVVSILIFLTFYLISIFQGFSFGFYSDDFSISMLLNYLIGCLITLVILIYSIHLEYDISRTQKYNLRDKYSHDLGNLVQVIYSAAILTNVEEDLKKEKADNLNLIQKKCEEAAKLIKDIKDTQ